ncbi:malto-oligosyltrehalose synthase [Streptosporangium carneum]|uniref:Malto-oligosyltrehalose synthase n=1 Tax=Streptosporangium carneum TaxID=47481 RepID=A0A9W6HY47_9ACTN|nr:malto-oligosyltrehalose synthase [Streptosporangium carneum]GLK08178.1 malto-oligosyltrehalose synthase [Streptosporangium carneum]
MSERFEGAFEGPLNERSGEPGPFQEGPEASHEAAGRKPFPAPLSTYRIQLTPDFGFAEVAELAPYLRDLGVSHVYLSPILQATPQSRHGYDVIDHSRVRREFGGVEGLRELSETLTAHGLGVVVDIVPNHMTVPVPESGNRQLWSVLREGRASPYASWFDIDWEGGGGRLNMPVIGDSVEPVADGDVLRYHDHEFPLPDTHYRLVEWRSGPGYRRFFDVSSLIGLRVEDPEVFDATHEVILGLVGDGVVHGLRVDHPDGLAEPRGYLARLREASGVWTVAEKILVGSERLPADWDCDGTTGYDVLNRITGLFVDPAGERPLVDLFVARTGMPRDYATVVRQSKREVLDLFFAAEIDRLHAVVGSDRETLVELLAAMPVYRAYAVPGEPVPAASAEIVEAAGRLAATRLPEGAPVAEVVDRVLYGPAEAVTRFQQTCGPVMAKGVEDTALYRWYPLACLNEVGGEPDRFGGTVDGFHAFCRGMAPGTMTTLSTHDTKRSEDVRARLAVLSELPQEWARAVEEWSSKVSFDPVLDYLAWQNLMAAWPIGPDRFFEFLFKAAREAKTSISWATPDPAYEQGIRDFVTRAVDECGASVAAFAAMIEPYARSNSLGQKLVQLMLPGVPDLYWGNEITDFSLVDPDNRRPVDFARRRALLAEGAGDPVRAGLGADTGSSWEEDKLRVTVQALRLRGRLDPALPYVPIEADEHAVAFARGDRAVAVATRLPVGLARRGGWGSETITLPHGRWRDLLSGVEHTGRIPLAHLLSAHPVALLERE